MAAKRKRKREGDAAVGDTEFLSLSQGGLCARLAMNHFRAVADQNHVYALPMQIAQTRSHHPTPTEIEAATARSKSRRRHDGRRGG